MTGTIAEWVSPESFVALATFTLAILTYWLAKSASADVEAQWRPLMVPRISELIYGEAHAPVDNGGLGFRFGIENIGKGAALEVVGSFLNEDGLFVRCDSLPNPVVAEGQHRVCSSDDDGPARSATDIRVRIHYQDISYASYETEVSYTFDDVFRWSIASVQTKRIGRRGRLGRALYWLAEQTARIAHRVFSRSRRQS